MPKKLVSVGESRDGILVFPPAQLESRRQWLNSSQTFIVIETLSIPRKSKSPNQLGYIFAGIINHVKMVLDDRGWDVGDTGTPWTKEQIKAVLYHQFNVRNNTNFRLSDPDNDIAKTSEFIDSCLNWLAGSPWRIAVPDPRPKT